MTVKMTRKEFAKKCKVLDKFMAKHWDNLDEKTQIAYNDIVYIASEYLMKERK